MKNKGWIVIIVAFILITSYSGSKEGKKTGFGCSSGGNNLIEGKTYYVSKQGSDANDGSEQNPWLTMQKAVDSVKAGDAVYMPKGWAHAAVNIGDTFFVTADDSPVNFEDVEPSSLPGHADYEPIKKMRGMAYYIVEEHGEPTLVKNPAYKKVPDAEIEDWRPEFAKKE